MTVSCIVEKVNELKEKHCESDPYRLARAMGVAVTPMDIGKCLGFFVCVDRERIITLNISTPEALQRVVCAHELGHAVLHADSAPLSFPSVDYGVLTTEASGKEYEANVFAAELLLEDADVMENLRDGLSFYDTAAVLGIPSELLAFKLRVMQKKGYDIPELPRMTDSTFLKDVSFPEEEYYE